MSTIAISPSRIRQPAIHHRPAARRAGSGVTVRLTRRGRVVLFLVALTAVLVVGFFWGAGSVATQERGTSPATEVVMVAPGETLWDIASRLTPAGDDVRDTMYDIKRLNALSSSGARRGPADPGARRVAPHRSAAGRFDPGPAATTEYAKGKTRGGPHIRRPAPRACGLSGESGLS